MKKLEKAFKGQIVRVEVDKDNREWFSVLDVGKILELKDVQRRARNLPEKGRLNIPTLTKGGIQNLMYIDEPNLYRLIFTSRKDEAIEFQNWIFDEVIPSIRKTGKYSIPDTLKSKSVDTRKMLTDEWHKNGVNKGWEYGKLTLSEYRSLKFEEGLRKKDLDEGQVKALLALEAMEMLNLHYNPVKGFLECKTSLQGTAKKVLEVKKNEIQLQNNQNR